MKKYILGLVLGLIIALPVSAQTSTRAALIAQLIAQINILQAQIRPLQQRQFVPTGTSGAAVVFYAQSSGLRLDYLQEVGASQRNVLTLGHPVTIIGTGFSSSMKVIISGQRPTEQAYTAVMGATYISPNSLSLILPSDVPTSALDIHLADVTSRTSRVSNTLQATVTP